jgi:hypothetical protein
MDILPPRQQRGSLFRHDPHGLADFDPRHPVGPDQMRPSIVAQQVDLGLAVAEDMDVRGRLASTNITMRNPPDRYTVTMPFDILS